jgi:hypothetical protein
VSLLGGVCVIGELKEACWAALVVWLVPQRRVDMSPVVVMLVLQHRGYVCVAGGGCASVAVPCRCVGAVCISWRVCRKCGWLSGQTYILIPIPTCTYQTPTVLRQPLFPPFHVKINSLIVTGCTARYFLEGMMSVFWKYS